MGSYRLGATVTDSIRVRCVSVGQRRTVSWGGRSIDTAFRKRPVIGPVWVTGAGMAGDEQCDTRHHGGPDKALLVYPSEHYPAWGTQLGTLSMPAFGENLTTEGIVESDAVIGSVFDIGSATVQVSQPRRACYKLAAIYGVRDLAVTMQDTGRTGFYLRVLSPGEISPGDRIVLVDEPRHGITSSEVHRVLNLDHDDTAAVRRLLEHPEVLPRKWLRILEGRVTSGDWIDDSARLHGAPPPEPKKRV